MPRTHKVCIGGVIRNAMVLNFKNARDEAMNADSMLEQVDRLFALLDERGIEYVLVGGVALLQYVEGRNTEDIDLIMASASLDDLPEIEIADREPHFARGHFGALRVDILLTDHPLFDKVRRVYATTQPFVERDIPCATVEGLLLLKLHALPSFYRQGNFARVGLYENDVATLLHDCEAEPEPLFEELAPHLSKSDMASLRDIVSEIRQRIERFRNGQRNGPQ